MTSKLSQQQAATQDSKENIKQEIKEEGDNAAGENSTQIKEEAANTTAIKKEGAEESEVSIIFIKSLNTF